jgi:hypothetical protein
MVKVENHVYFTITKQEIRISLLREDFLLGIVHSVGNLKGAETRLTPPSLPLHSSSRKWYPINMSCEECYRILRVSDWLGDQDRLS